MLYLQLDTEPKDIYEIHIYEFNTFRRIVSQFKIAYGYPWLSISRRTNNLTGFKSTWGIGDIKSSVKADRFILLVTSKQQIVYCNLLLCE